MDSGVKKISCLRAMDKKDLFKNALGEIYSERYFEQQEKNFDDNVFVF
jgi:hypothetical protein